MIYRIKLAILRSLVPFHKFMLRFGVQVLRNHFYSCVPDVNELARTKHIWAKKSDLPGVGADLDRQLANLKEICLKFQGEYAGNVVYNEAWSQVLGPGFGYVEAQALHAFLRHLKPRRIIEVGSGVSTKCALAALELNEKEGAPCRMTCIEPYPFPWLKATSAIDLVEQKVQESPIHLFTSLEDGDFLFIDSSHAVKVGSDVNYIILEILPRLNKGVRVHFHDIHFPFDYQRDTLQTIYFASETSLLRAFLIHNSSTRILFSLSMLHYDRPESLKEVFPEYEHQVATENGLMPNDYKPFTIAPGHYPSSLYFQVV